MVYLIVAGQPQYVGRVLLGPSFDGEGGGRLYELRGLFSAFYTEWLDGAVQSLSCRKYYAQFNAMPYAEASPGIQKPAVRVLFPGPASAKAVTPDFIDEAGIGCWLCTEDKSLMTKGEVIWSERYALHLPGIDRHGNALSEYVLAAFILAAGRIGLDQRNKATGYRPTSDTGRVQQERVWILYSENEVSDDSLRQLARRVLEEGDQDEVAIELRGRVELLRR